MRKVTAYTNVCRIIGQVKLTLDAVEQLKKLPDNEAKYPTNFIPESNKYSIKFYRVNGIDHILYENWQSETTDVYIRNGVIEKCLKWRHCLNAEVEIHINAKNIDRWIGDLISVIPFGGFHDFRKFDIFKN